MKSSEAKLLTADELKTLRSLLQRWILREYPDAFGGSSEESDAVQTYISIKEDAEHGCSSSLRFHKTQEEVDKNDQERIDQYGENDLD